jgi:threonine dehydrogenase-like Zn-dependent dehydrogenase
MRALTFDPHTANSARLEDVDEPPLEDGSVLVETLALGVCGTDLDLVAGHFGFRTTGRGRLILGHESLGRVTEAPPGSGLAPGDLVAGIVRRRDPVPCPDCAAGEWDLCRDGRYTERGIIGRNGYGSERFRIEPEFAVKVAPALGVLGVLMEPASVLAKAWEQIERIGRRGRWSPKRLLVTGAGPIGLLAALMGAQRGLEVHVLDRVEGGAKPGLVRDLGATYHTGPLEGTCAEADVVIECTSSAPIVVEAIHRAAPNGIVCLIGAGHGQEPIPTDWDALTVAMIVRNLTVFGSVSANRRHFEAAAEALARADRGWLARLITRRVSLDRWDEALERRPDDVKSIIVMNDGPQGAAVFEDGPPRSAPRPVAPGA